MTIGLKFPKPVKVKKAPHPLQRSRMRRRKPRRLLRQTPADRRYLAWLHTQPCMGAECIHGHVCSGPIEASHFRDMTGLGMKSPDTTCIPLCKALHEDYDQARGFFLGIPLDERKIWHVSQRLKAMIRFEMEEIASIY